jgi:hypothetical protein
MSTTYAREREIATARATVMMAPQVTAWAQVR